MLLQNKSVPVRRISEADNHMFFGYYDLCPYDRDGKYHLAHKVPFADRLQTRGDWAQLGIIELSTGKFFDLDTTEAWNFQQGAMLQWNPQKPNEEILFNIFDGHEFRGCRLNIKDGNKTTYEKPFANVSKDGKYALGINFSRLYDFRPGYGYAATGDPFFYHKHSNRDGVFLTDLETGSCKLVLTLEEIWDFSHSFFGGKDEKLIINHITFNPSGTRFLMLVRYFPAKGERQTLH